MTHALAAEIMTFDDTCVTLADGGTGDVYFLSVLENTHLYFRTRSKIVTFAGVQTKFLQPFGGFDFSFGQLPGNRPVNTTFLAASPGNLDSPVTTLIGINQTGYTVGRSFDHGHGDGSSVICKDAGHTTLASDYSDSHCIGLLLLVKFDLHVHAGSQIQFHECINGLVRRVDDIHEALVCTDLVLITRILVDMR